MYVEQEIYFVDSDILKIIFLQKTMNEDAYFWILGPGSFKIIGIYDSHVQSSTVVLTNNFWTSIVQVPILSKVKIKPSENTVFCFPIRMMIFSCS